MPSRARLFVLLLALGTASCGRAPAPLAHASESPEALARQVLEAFYRSDLAALERLALSEREFRQIAWPELPAARPERNLPWDYVWNDLRQKSRASLAALLARHGKRRYEFRSMTFRGGTTAYATYRIGRDTELTVLDEAGAERPLRLFGSMLNRAGSYKVFSFVVD